MSFDEYLEKMECRRKREKETAINAELQEDLSAFTHDEAVARMFFLLGGVGVTEDIITLIPQRLVNPI